MSPKLQNISERNMRHFPRMHSPCKLKAKNPKLLWQELHLKAAQRHPLEWAHRPHEPRWRTAARTRRGIRSSPLMGLTHQTLLTSTNEWNLRFSHGLNLSGEANLKSERASGLQLPSISQSPADSLQQPGCLWAVRERAVGRGKEERGGEPGILCSTHPWAPSSNVPCEWAHCVTASDCSWTGRWGRGPSLSPLGYRPPRNPGWNGESCKQWHTAFPKWSGHHLK